LLAAESYSEAVNLFRLRGEHLLVALDLIGTALFATEGAATAMASHLDLLGILVISFLTALGGGIVRDLLLGATPPNSIRDWRYAAVALASGMSTFALHPSASAMGNEWLVAMDAAGLSLFAVAGATKALKFEIHPLLAVMMGGITGVGGGTLRDVLINKVPIVLRADVYATAALLGAAVVVVLLRLGVKPIVANICGIVACFVLRMVAVQHHWNLPVRG
jgi:uncharacterized membrane protein YeiH